MKLKKVSTSKFEVLDDNNKSIFEFDSYDFDRLRNSHIGTSIVKHQLCRNIFG